MSDHQQKDRHTKFGPSAGVPSENSTKKPFDRSLSRQKDNKVVRKGDWANNNGDILALEDQKADEEEFEQVAHENDALAGKAQEVPADNQDQGDEQKKPKESDFPAL